MRTSFGVRVCLVLAGAILAPATAARGQELARDTLRLSLAEAQRIATERNATFLALSERVNVERGALRQARLLFNPEAEAEAPAVLSGDGIDRYEARVSQEIEWAGQRGLRVDAAELGIRTARLDVDRARLELTAEVGRAYYAALATRRRLEHAAELLALNERLAAAVGIQEAEGEISVMDANIARIEVGRARARLLSAQREARSADATLVLLLGLEPTAELELDTEVPPAPQPTALDPNALVQSAVDSRADLAALRVLVEQAEVRARLATREAIPNVRLGAIAEREEDTGTRFGVAVGLPIPIWNRNQGLVQQREAEARQAALLVEAAELRIRSEVLDAWRRYVSASEEAAVLEEQVLEPAHENQEMLATAYEAGRIDLNALVLLRNQLLEAELDYWTAWLTQRDALVDLELATGSALSNDSIEGQP